VVEEGFRLQTAGCKGGLEFESDAAAKRPYLLGMRSVLSAKLPATAKNPKLDAEKAFSDLEDLARRM